MIYSGCYTNMKDKRARFFEECLSHCNGAAATVRAGYSSTFPNVTASRLPTKVDFHAARQVSPQLSGKALCLERERAPAELPEAIEAAGSIISLGGETRPDFHRTL